MKKLTSVVSMIFYGLLCGLIMLGFFSSCFPKYFPPKDTPIVQDPNGLAHRRDGLDVQGHRPGTETQAGCKDAGGTPLMNGDRFIYCYQCTLGQAGKTCARKL